MTVAWRQLRYEGPALRATTMKPPRAPRFGSLGAPAVGLALLGVVALAGGLVALRPTAWPDALRPLVRTLPPVSAPSLGPESSFRMPSRPSRSTCFTAVEACDDTAG